MKRFVLLVVLAFALFSFSFTATPKDVSAQDAIWTMKYQFLAPRSITVDKVITVPDPDNPGEEKLKVVKETYWYQLFYLKNPTKETITLSFGSTLLVDTVKKVRDPETGEEIDVSSMLPAFKGDKPNFVVNKKTGNKIIIPGTAFRPVHDQTVCDSVIEELRIRPLQDDQFKNSFKSDLLTERPLRDFYNGLDLTKPFKPEEIKQVILLYKDLDPGFDSLIFHTAGLTNEYFYNSEEDKLAGKGFKSVLCLEYERPGDEFDTDDTNPEPVDLFHLHASEWIKVPIL